MLEPLLRYVVQPWVLVATGGVVGRWLLLAAARVPARAWGQAAAARTVGTEIHRKGPQRP